MRRRYEAPSQHLDALYHIPEGTQGVALASFLRGHVFKRVAPLLGRLYYAQ